MYKMLHVCEKTHFFSAAFLVRARKNHLNVVPPSPFLECLPKCSSLYFVNTSLILAWKTFRINSVKMMSFNDESSDTAAP
mmetsp:Transcript_20061/g.30755  ORF Transcript_20061/g.30755 Transcript_20061/m.30755 type:complete len:80 (+) Transcript_20061:103-342(+)